MHIDNTTYKDLALFHSDEEFSLFHKLNLARTSGGREWLRRFFNSPFNDLKKITETQLIVKTILHKLDDWPVTITNGTIMVVERFYETALDNIPHTPSAVNAFGYKVFHAPDFSLVRYSLTHFADFCRGLQQLAELFDEEAPLLIRSYLLRTRELLNRPVIQSLMTRPTSKPFTWTETIRYGSYVRNHFKNPAQELVNIYGRLDAWYAMAMAMKKYKLAFPVFVEQDQPMVHARELYHLLLSKPVSYDITLHPDNNFIFLTGANMAGKSTFIKAAGTAVFMAHLGMGVPATTMQLTLFDGLLSNINVMDNLVKGESYFYNEVQRIKNTILQINDGKKWLVLIDELFKGTNVQDAMKCSSAVIKGLIKIRNSLFILSTHLYEIGEDLKQYPNISFKYFETAVNNDQLAFSYQLKEGISNDRLGYLILKREKVVELLENL